MKRFLHFALALLAATAWSATLPPPKATMNQVTEGTNDTAYITPKQLKTYIDTLNLGGGETGTAPAGFATWYSAPTVENFNAILTNGSFAAVGGTNAFTGLNSFVGLTTFTGAMIRPAHPQTTAQMNVARSWSTRTITGTTETGTLSATPADGTVWTVEYTATGGDCTYTPPAGTFLYDTQGATTTFLIPNGTTKLVTYVKEAGRIMALGTGVLTIGSGPFQLTLQEEKDVAATTSTDIGNQVSRNIRVTGSGVTITSFGTASSGVIVDGRFAGVNTLTHNASTLILTGGANITTAANDRFRAYSLGSGAWVVTYIPASGRPVIKSSILASGGSLTSVIDGVVAQTDVVTVTVPANTLLANKSVRLTAWGQLKNSSGSNRGLSFTALTYGGTSFMNDASGSTALVDNANYRPWTLEVEIIGLSSSSQTAFVAFMVGPVAGSGGGVGDLAGSSAWNTRFTGTATVDATADQILKLRVAFTGSDNAGLKWDTWGYVLTER